MEIKKGLDPVEKLEPDKLVIVHSKRIGFKEPEYSPFPSATLFPSIEIFPQQP